MGDYVFTEQELNELKELFFIEAYEILQSLDQEVLNLETGKDRDSALKTIQRNMHTLKGNSKALGFAYINTLTHRSEDLVKTIQDSKGLIDQDLSSLLFAVNDALRVLVDGYKANTTVMIDHLLLERIDNRLKKADIVCGEVQPAASDPDCGSGACLFDVHITFAEACGSRSTAARMILERMAVMGEIINTDPAISSDALERTTALIVRFGSPHTAADIGTVLTMPGIVSHTAVKKREPRAEKDMSLETIGSAIRDEAAHTLRVDLERVDKILNQVGELVIGRSLIGQLLIELGERHKKDDLIKRLSAANVFMEKTLSVLQKNVMKIRMLPISQVFRKFPRVVRDLALEKGKQVDLIMSGEKTELDKSILDVIGEPLIHLVRNAVDHGIEKPEDRERKGKPRAGKVVLSAYHEANQIVVSVSDDGAGLDPERLRRTAVEKRMKSQEDADHLTDDDAIALIFLAGFSTTKELSDISGRGVGMDIVRSTIESLKGRIDVRSSLGEGTTFTLRMPLTLAIIRAMLFHVGARLFAIPMSSVEKILRVKDCELQTIAGKNVLRYRDSVISLIQVNDPLMVHTAECGREKNAFIVIVKLGDTFYGFLVDRIEGQQELVIKSLDDHWGMVKCTSGASILGSGKVVLILDAAALIAKELGKSAALIGSSMNVKKQDARS